MSEIIVPNPITEQVIKDYLFTSETKLTEKQQAMFMQMAIRHKLDPFKREIYAIAYGKEFQIVTGYQVYIERADSSGKLNGWECVTTEKGAEITIYRKDWEHPFKWPVSYKEFNKGHGSWLKMPEFMIRKVCIGQGFRLAFPVELGGMPYLQEEIEYATSDNKPVQETVQHPKSKSVALIEEVKELTVITFVHKVTKSKKSGQFKILGDEDIIYTTLQETFAILAKDAELAKLQISITHRENIILNIELVEPAKETQEEFLDGLDKDAVEEGFKSKKGIET